MCRLRMVVAPRQQSRRIPLQCPWNDNLYAIALDYQSVGSDESVGSSRPWGSIAVTVTFGALKWFPTDPSQPYIVKRYRGAGRIITIPGTAYTFSGGERREAGRGQEDRWPHHRDHSSPNPES